jgi:hypothetical protein
MNMRRNSRRRTEEIDTYDDDDHDHHEEQHDDDDDQEIILTTTMLLLQTLLDTAPAFDLPPGLHESRPPAYPEPDPASIAVFKAKVIIED